MSITVNNISKAYGAQQVLNDISFSIDQGQIVGFLGPNGAGKSTMMKILTTYITADTGTAVVAGHDTSTDERAVQKTVGYLPEHNPLYLDMYVKEYLGFISELYKINKQRITEVIEQTGLTPESHKKISQLSKGYRQRVGLAAALIPDPEVLILDEPTTGLDPNQLVDIRNLIISLGKTKTVLLSTHIMQEVEAMCDRVIIIKKGSIVADRNLSDMREDGTQVLEIEFDYRVEPEFLKRIEHLDQVENAGYNYTLHFNTDEDMRGRMFDFAQENELKILSMNRKNKDLESLFKELTTE